MIISNVRMQSAAGHYLGSIECVDGEFEPYDRRSLYYPDEEWLELEFPNSIGLEEAFECGEAREKLRRR